MDISDGLSTDLSRLCKASGVGSPDLRRADTRASMFRSRYEKYAEVSILLPWRSMAAKIMVCSLPLPSGGLRRIPRIFGRTRITRIGEVVRGSGSEHRCAGWRSLITQAGRMGSLRETLRPFAATQSRRIGSDALHKRWSYAVPLAASKGCSGRHSNRKTIRPGSGRVSSPPALSGDHAQ